MEETRESKLRLWEGMIEDQMGKVNWQQVGRALLIIREERLYLPDGAEGSKSHYKEWESYCLRRWKWSRNYCNRLIRAYQEAREEESVPTGTQILPANEAQARALRPLDDPEEKRLAMLDARERAGQGKITAGHVRDAVNARQGKPPGEKNPLKNALPPLTVGEMAKLCDERYTRGELELLVQLLQQKLAMREEARG